MVSLFSVETHLDFVCRGNPVENKKLLTFMQPKKPTAAIKDEAG